jgi:hypothetical protein
VTIEQLLMLTIGLTVPALWLIDKASAAFWRWWHSR